MWWNLENFFDTDNDPISRDFEYTPEFGWTLPVFNAKKANLAAAIKATHGGQGPELLAVAEIEKRRIAILGESVAIEKEEQQKADVRVGKPESAWRLCDSDLAMTITETTERIGSELVQTNVGPLCYSWTGTRKNWKEIILRDGCKGRCNPV